MKLLFDENLSSQLVEILAAVFPGSRHVAFNRESLRLGVLDQRTKNDPTFSVLLVSSDGSQALERCR
jgi:hypothetical protein